MSDNSLLGSLEALQAEIHKDCKHDNPQCACACGCEVRIGCTCWADVCTDCQMNWTRGRDPEPGRLPANLRLRTLGAAPQPPRRAPRRTER